MSLRVSTKTKFENFTHVLNDNKQSFRINKKYLFGAVFKRLIKKLAKNCIFHVTAAKFQKCKRIEKLVDACDIPKKNSSL